MTNEELSRQYHSLRFYDGVVNGQYVNYRIGDTTTRILDEIEHYYDTWIDFRLIPTERPTVALPKPNTKFVSIPGRTNPIDMTTYLTGHTTYTNRTGQWSFFTDNDFVENYSYGSNKGFIAFEKSLRDKLHGRVMKVALRDDPGYFYAGEISIGELRPARERSTLTVSYNLYPYKKSMQSSMDLWKFDEFDFHNGVVMYLKDMEVNGSREVIIYGSTERVSPHISGSSGLVVDKWNGSSWSFKGDVPTEPITSLNTIVPRLVIEDGVNRLRFRGNGTVTIDYRRGLL